MRGAVSRKQLGERAAGARINSNARTIKLQILLINNCQLNMFADVDLL